MPRPRKFRRVCHYPQTLSFAPEEGQGKDPLRQQQAQEIGKGQEHGDSGHRHAAVEFIAAALGLLALALQHIEEAQPDHGAEAVEATMAMPTMPFSP